MISFADLMGQGGAFTWVTAVFASVALLVAAIIPLVIGFLKWRVPASLSWFAIAATLAIGVTGTALGMQMAWQALAVAAPDMRDTLHAAGASVAMYASIVGLWGAVLVALAACCAAVIPAVAAVGPKPRVDARGLLASSAGGLLAALCAVGVLLGSVGFSGLTQLGWGLIIVPAVCLAVTLATIVACARIASEDHLHQGRIVGSRFFVGVTGGLALVLLGELFRANGASFAAGALATASAEVRPLLVGMGREFASSGPWLGWVLACVPVCAALCGSLHWVRRVDGRNAVGAAVMGVAGIVMSAMIYAAHALCFSGLTWP